MSKKKYAVSDDVLINAINIFPISKLMLAADIVCGADYAVRFYPVRQEYPVYNDMCRCTSEA